MFTGARKARKQVTNVEMHSSHLQAMDKYQKVHGVSPTVSMNIKHMQKQFVVTEGAKVCL